MFLPEGRELNGKASQTMLRHFNGCPRSAYLYTYFKGVPQSVEMVRGSALHEICERCTRAAIENDAVSIPWELAKPIADEVIAEYPLAIEEHDYVREMAWRWAENTTFDPPNEVACETLFVWDVAGWQVRCKIDRAVLADEGVRCIINDYKSSRAAVTYEDISRLRPGTITRAAKAFQLILYACCVAFGVPVRESVEFGERVETPEMFGIAGQVQDFDLAFVYPGIRAGDGMLDRVVTLTRRELEDYRVSIVGILGRLGEAEREGDWPAVVSDSACSECPASVLCPIPEEIRDMRGTINTMAEAADVAEAEEIRKKRGAATQKELKAFAKRFGEIRYGLNKAMRFSSSTSVRIEDKDAMFDAVERAAEYGETFDRGLYMKEVTSNKFGPETLAADEINDEEEDAPWRK